MSRKLEIASFQRSFAASPSDSRSAWVGGAARLLSGAALGQILMLLAYPVISRLYSPSDLGVLAVYTSTLGIIAVVASFRFDQAIPIPKSRRDAKALLALAVAVSIAVSFISGIIALVYSEWSFSKLDRPLPTGVLLLLPLGVLLVSVYQALSMFSLRERLYGRIGATRAMQGGASACIQIVGGLVGAGPLGLVAGHIIGQSAGSVSLGLGVLRPFRGSVRLRDIWFVARRYARFAYMGMPSALLNTAALLLPAILIASAYDLRSAGLYGLAVMLLSAPVQLVGRSSAQVFYAEAMREVHGCSSAVGKLLTQVTVRLAIISVVPTAVLMVASRPIFEVVFGQEWAGAVPYVQILAGAYFLSLITAPASQVFLIAERQGLSLMLNVLKVMVTFGAFAYVPNSGGGIHAALIYYAGGMSIYYLMVWNVAYLILRKLAGRSCPD